MKTTIMTLFLLSAVISTASADGMMIAHRTALLRERALINEVEQKAMVLFQDGVENLIISPSFDGEADKFAWIIPVPSVPQVDILEGALFHELARVVPDDELRPEYDRAKNETVKDAVEVIERRTVGAYDVSVISADAGQSLAAWLKENGYQTPTAAVKLIDEYIKDKWLFVACRIEDPGISKGLTTGTLAPIRLVFKADNPVYPMRLSSANPEAFDLLVYLVVLKPNSIVKSYVKQNAYLDNSVGYDKLEPATTIVIEKAMSPTLSKIAVGTADIYMLRRRLEPSSCTTDLYWTQTVATPPSVWPVVAIASLVMGLGIRKMLG